VKSGVKKGLQNGYDFFTGIFTGRKRREGERLCEPVCFLRPTEEFCAHYPHAKKCRPCFPMCWMHTEPETTSYSDEDDILAVKLKAGHSQTQSKVYRL
jgi:hypothetical protein